MELLTGNKGVFIMFKKLLFVFSSLLLLFSVSSYAGSTDHRILPGKVGPNTDFAYVINYSHSYVKLEVMYPDQRWVYADLEPENDASVSLKGFSTAYLKIYSRGYLIFQGNIFAGDILRVRDNANAANGLPTVTVESKK